MIKTEGNSDYRVKSNLSSLTTGLKLAPVTSTGNGISFAVVSILLGGSV